MLGTRTGARPGQGKGDTKGLVHSSRSYNLATKLGGTRQEGRTHTHTHPQPASPVGHRRDPLCKAKGPRSSTAATGFGIKMDWEAFGPCERAWGRGEWGQNVCWGAPVPSRGGVEVGTATPEAHRNGT